MASDDSAALAAWVRDRLGAIGDADASEGAGAAPALSALLPANTTIAGIEAELLKLVQGQERSVREISVLLSMHVQWGEHSDPLHPPPKAIVIGPTGSGKTFTLQTAARYLGLPFVSVDASALVPAGIVGVQVEDVISDLVVAADAILEERSVPRTKDDQLRLAERGVILLDEFDKIATEQLRDKDIALGVQRRLLKLIEGASVAAGVRRHTEETAVRTINTAGVLVVASGAFAGIEKLRPKRPQSISRRPELRDQILSVDIINYGFIPELVARLPVLIQYGKLGAEALVNILRNEATSPLTVWRNYVASFGGDITVAEDALRAIADRAIEADIGARGLQQIVFSSLAQVIAQKFDGGVATSTEIRITKADLL